MQSFKACSKDTQRQRLHSRVHIYIPFPALGALREPTRFRKSQSISGDTPVNTNIQLSFISISFHQALFDTRKVLHGSMRKLLMKFGLKLKNLPPLRPSLLNGQSPQ